MRVIKTKVDLLVLARELQVRRDWHEPDEQGVTAVFGGKDFDNAMLDESELSVTIYQLGRPMAQINLAILLAWATGYQDDIDDEVFCIAVGYRGKIICRACADNPAYRFTGREVQYTNKNRPSALYCADCGQEF